MGIEQCLQGEEGCGNHDSVGGWSPSSEGGEALSRDSSLSPALKLPNNPKLQKIILESSLKRIPNSETSKLFTTLWFNYRKILPVFLSIYKDKGHVIRRFIQVSWNAWYTCCLFRVSSSFFLDCPHDPFSKQKFIKSTVGNHRAKLLFVKSPFKQPIGFQKQPSFLKTRTTKKKKQNHHGQSNIMWNCSTCGFNMRVCIHTQDLHLFTVTKRQCLRV